MKYNSIERISFSKYKTCKEVTKTMLVLSQTGAACYDSCRATPTEITMTCIDFLGMATKFENTLMGLLNGQSGNVRSFLQKGKLVHYLVQMNKVARATQLAVQENAHSEH